MLCVIGNWAVDYMCGGIERVSDGIGSQEKEGRSFSQMGGEIQYLLLFEDCGQREREI